MVHFDNWNEDDKEMLSPVRREEEEEKNSIRVRQKKREREKKCVYTESGQQHVPPSKSYCIHFPVIRASSSSRLHIHTYIYIFIIKKTR